MSELIFLLPAFVACLVLTGIHTYLGMHVIQREVIFLDIALAQIAALGMTVGHLWHFEPDSTAAYLCALFFTTLGAVFFTFVKTQRVPQEAIIGVAFAVSSALGILVANRLPHGGEHLKYVLSGNVLWVTWPQIVKTALIYGAIGLFHYCYRRQFWRLSKASRTESERLEGTRWWNLLFYLTFGLVITSSVQIGGILLVFSFLIVPAICSVLFCNSVRSRLCLGWAIGVLSSIVGISLSYAMDWPTGPAIVATFGVVLSISFLVRALTGARRRVLG